MAVCGPSFEAPPAAAPQDEVEDFAKLKAATANAASS
jgi:hypothetical protein